MLRPYITICDKRCNIVKDGVQTRYLEIIPRIGEKISIDDIGEFTIEDIIHTNVDGLGHHIDIYLDYDQEDERS